MTGDRTRQDAALQRPSRCCPAAARRCISGSVAAAKVLPPMEFSVLPPINASLNACAMVLLVYGRRLALRGETERHRRVMLSAFGVSTLFLLLYVGHKVSRNFENTTFNAEGIAQTAYLVLLGSHVVLAMTIPVFAIALIRLGLRDERERHRRIARIAWPIWMYVSMTGVLIYLLLYPFNPPTGSV